MATSAMAEINKYAVVGQYGPATGTASRSPILVEETIHRTMALIDLVDEQFFALENRLAIVLRPQPPGQPQAEEGAAQHPSCPLEENLMQITRRLAASLMFLERLQNRLVL